MNSLESYINSHEYEYEYEPHGNYRWCHCEIPKNDRNFLFSGFCIIGQWVPLDQCRGQWVPLDQCLLIFGIL
jgi:hypothetical protein